MSGARVAAAPVRTESSAHPGTESLQAYLRPVRALLADDVTEVCINRPGETWTETARGWQRHAMPELTLAHLRQLALLIAHAAQQAINETAPIVSTALPSGERVQVIIPPACESQTVSITIRRHSAQRFSVADYERMGFFADVAVRGAGLRAHEARLLDLLRERRLREFFELAVRERLTMLVSGATGSGKTTFMKALVDLVPHDERLITIEDTPELSLSQPNHVRLFYTKGEQGLTRLSAGDLVQACMRMKPDRIFPAELRDEAAYHFLLAANTGHPGSITSIHANDELEALPRLAALAAEAPAARTTPLETLLHRTRETIDVVVHLGRVHGQRRITGIHYDPHRKRAALG